MQAVCFQCGGEKSDPFKLCCHCHTRPLSDQDLLTSMCLSHDCLKPSNLLKASRYIKKKKRPPGFRDKVKQRAQALLSSRSDETNSQSHLFDLSDSFFQSDPAPEAPSERVVVHAIGRPATAEHNRNCPDNRSQQSTYQRLEWVVGKDISSEDVEIYGNPAGEIYIWYRWMGSKWVWKCVSSSEFDKLRALEGPARRA